MKVADMEKMMAAVVEATEKKYPGVKALVKTNEWAKGAYHRLYIGLICIAKVNGEEKTEEADFGFINLKTNRYNVKGYDMRHFDADELMGAKMLYDYDKAYKAAESDKKLYVAKENYRLVVGVSEEEEAKGISRKEMLDKSLEMGIMPSSFDTYWSVLGDVDTDADTEEEEQEESRVIGSYDGHVVTTKHSKSGDYIVEDNGKYTGDYARDEDGGVYKAACYLYDQLDEGHRIKVADDDAYAYIVENAEGLGVKITADDNGQIYKEE